MKKELESVMIDGHEYVYPEEHETMNTKDSEYTYRVAKNAYDEAYIEAYCRNPAAGKPAALLEAGYVGKYLRQEANRIHNRLRDRIEAEFDKMVLDGGMLGFDVLVKLAKESDSDAVKAKCAKDLMDYSGRKPGDKLTIKRDMSEEELDNEIARVQRELANAEGRHLDS